MRWFTTRHVAHVTARSSRSHDGGRCGGRARAGGEFRTGPRGTGALAHPDASEEIYRNADSSPYELFRDAYADTFTGRRGLLNGQSMLAHDAVLAALGTAIRDAAGEDGEDRVTRKAVRQMLLTRGEHEYDYLWLLRS